MTQTQQQGIVERCLGRSAEILREYRVPILASLAAGMLTHGFAFTNKLLNGDEITALFGKGGGIDYGRWTIGLTSLLFPDASMPWIYGILSMLFFTAIVCITIRLFAISNPYLQGVLGAVFLSFPYMTGLYCYMFTSMPFALSLLLAVLSVCMGCSENRLIRLGGCLPLIFSLGIYQAYIAVAASYYVLLMIRRLLREEGSPEEVLLFGVKALARMGIALAVYYIGSRIALHSIGESYAEHGFSEHGILYRVALAYNALWKALAAGYFGYVPTKLSMILHVMGAGIVILLLGMWFARHYSQAKRAGLLLLCLLLLPLAMNCVFLLANVEVIHTIVLYSFVSVYVLIVILLEQAEGNSTSVLRNLTLAGMLLITISNIYFGNETYLKMYLQYENAYSYYTSVVTRIGMTEGFDSDCTIALMGRGGAAFYEVGQIDTGDLTGPEKNLLNVYSKERMIRQYLGFDVPFATWEEQLELGKLDEVKAMPEYPYPGSVKRVGNYIVVMLG